MCFRDVCSVSAVFEVESRENRTESQKKLDLDLDQKFRINFQPFASV